MGRLIKIVSDYPNARRMDILNQGIEREKNKLVYFLNRISIKSSTGQDYRIIDLASYLMQHEK
ncbi:MAG: hypothetical protein A2029_03055 [Chloroflexi bacterium RBG_19FT_COMBO_47_9]|nr:MAG: hypothetical protein A2029_03055 [Chloroflexi bacterium RBG_19FT_COMBO_47_9]